jgi:hypothetical protein
MKLPDPKWNTLFVVCKDCRKRKNVPDGLKAKALVRTIKHQPRDGRPKSRAVVSACLGLCPDGAVAIAIAGREQAFELVAVESERQLEAFLQNTRAAVAET